MSSTPNSQQESDKFPMRYFMISLAVLAVVVFAISKGSEIVYRDSSREVRVIPRQADNSSQQQDGETAGPSPNADGTKQLQQIQEDLNNELTQLENLRSELYSTKASVTRDTSIENCIALIGQLKTIQSDFQTQDSTIWENARSDYYKLKPKLYALLRKT